MRRKLFLASLLVFGTICFFACDPSTDKQETVQAPPVTTTPPPAVVQTLPAFKMYDVDGKVVDLASFKGKKVFVNLWASWCPPCRVEMPSIEKLYAQSNRENSVFVMLSLDENFDIAKQYARKSNLQAPVYYAAEPLPALFNTEGIPVTYIFDEEGKLIKRNDGMADYGTAEYISIFK